MKTFNTFIAEDEGEDSQLELIRKEHAGLKKMPLKDLRAHAARNNRMVDTKELTSKDQAITHILTRKHGRKKCVKALGWEE